MGEHGFKGHRIEITGGPVGWSTTVKIDGQLMVGVTDCTLRLMPNGVTKVMLTFVPEQLLVDAEAEIVRSLPVEKVKVGGDVDDFRRKMVEAQRRSG